MGAQTVRPQGGPLPVSNALPGSNALPESNALNYNALLFQDVEEDHEDGGSAGASSSCHRRYDFRPFFLHRDRELLYERCNERVAEMVRGLVCIHKQHHCYFVVVIITLSSPDSRSV